MSQLMNFVTPLHQATKRDYLARMIDDKVHCMHKAKEYEQDYWDGDRRFGYGGYKYLPGRWKPVAQALITNYGLKAGSRVLDVGCGKGFLLYEMQLIEPGLELVRFRYLGYMDLPARCPILRLRSFAIGPKILIRSVTITSTS